MATATATAANPDANSGRRRAAANVGQPRRKPLHIVTGALLVLLLALTFMWLQLRADQAASALVVARPVPAGQVIMAADLRTASIVPDTSVRLIAESEADSVVGQTAAVPLVVGALLSPDQIGPPAWPAAGDAVVALPIKPGRLPSGVTAGARVRVMTIATDVAAAPTAPGQPNDVVATVTDMASNVDSSGTVVVSLLLRSPDAGVAATSEAALVLLSPAG
jgi:hypothetical protein